MTTPSQPQRRLLARGAKQGSVWGTAVALGATDEILYPDPSGLDVPAIPILPALESDTPFVLESDLGNIPAMDFTIPVNMRYEMGAFGRLIAGLFGTSASPSLLDTTAYLHSFTWANEISGIFFTVCEERPSKIFEVASAKPTKLELSWADSLMKAGMTLRGNTCIETSSVNTATQIDALTYPSDFLDTRIRFQQVSLYINAESGGDVSGETPLVCNDFTVTYERPTEGGVHVAGQNTIIEALQDGLDGPSIIVDLSFPRSSSVNQAFFSSFNAETEQKMLIQATGALIESTYYLDLSLYFPRLRIKTVTYPDDEITKAGMILTAEEAGSNPTAMSDNRPYIEIVNRESVNYLT